jgi:hypothetical protein
VEAKSPMKYIFSTLFALVVTMLLILAPAYAQKGPSEDESNNTISLADSIAGSTIQGEVGLRNDKEDWFILEGQEGTYPKIILTYDPAKGDIDLEIYSDGALVGTLEGIESPDSGSFMVMGQCAFHVYAAKGRGKYTIDIEYGDSSAISDTGTPCQGPDEVEPNDTYDIADEIADNDIEGYVCPSDEDWFLLDGQEGVVPTFYLDYDPAIGDVDMEIYSDGLLVGVIKGTAGNESAIFHVPGQVYLRVLAFDGEGSYKITIDSGIKFKEREELIPEEDITDEMMPGE